jgi:hypothetical protein
LPAAGSTLAINLSISGASLRAGGPAARLVMASTFF